MRIIVFIFLFLWFLVIITRKMRVVIMVRAGGFKSSASWAAGPWIWLRGSWTLERKRYIGPLQTSCLGNINTETYVCMNACMCVCVYVFSSLCSIHGSCNFHLRCLVSETCVRTLNASVTFADLRTSVLILCIVVHMHCIVYSHCCTHALQHRVFSTRTRRHTYVCYSARCGATEHACVTVVP